MYVCSSSCRLHPLRHVAPIRRKVEWQIYSGVAHWLTERSLSVSSAVSATMGSELLQQLGVSFLTGVREFLGDPISSTMNFLLSNFHLICLAFAIYSAINSVIKLIGTPSICSSNLDPAVFVARRRLFALHGFNLSIRYGFCTLWLLSRQIHQINLANYGSSLEIFHYLAKIDYLSLMTTPLEIAILGKSVTLEAMAANNLFQGIVLLDLLSILFDKGFTNDYWVTVLESSKIPMKFKDVPLSMTYPYADMGTRMASVAVDNIIVATVSYFAMQLSVLKTPILDRIPADCDEAFLYFAIMYLLVGAVMRIVGKGSSIGRFLLGIDVIKGDGSPLDWITTLEREFYSFGFSCFFVAPLIVLLTDDGGSIVDLISSTREVDVMRIADRTLPIDGEDTKVSFPEYDSCKIYAKAPLSRPSMASSGSSSAKTTVKKTPSKTPRKTPSKTPKAKKADGTIEGEVSVVAEYVDSSPVSTHKSTGKRNRDEDSTQPTSSKKPVKTPAKTPKRKASESSTKPKKSAKK